MTILKYTAAATVALALILGAFAAALPFTASALDAPTCVLNTIVQPFNNGGTTLSWKVNNANTITLSGIGSVSDADSIVVYPSSVTEYTLTATGNAGVDTCTATALPTSSYPNIGQPVYQQDAQYKCEVSVEPDFVVPGGTAVLTWNVGNANTVSINPGIGIVGRSGSRVVPNTGVPQTFTLTAEWGNGQTRTCSATVHPGNALPPTFNAGINIPSVFLPVSQYTQTQFPTYPNAPSFPTVAPYNYNVAPAAPQVTATYTAPTTAYVSLAQVPYTGPNDAAYVLTLLAVALGAFALLTAQRRRIASVLASFSPTDNDDAEDVTEKVVIYDDSMPVISTRNR